MSKRIKQYIICDNPLCNHKESTTEKKLSSFINKPCPKCGENLLTVEDYNHHSLLIAVMKKVRKETKGIDDKGESCDVEFSAKDGVLRYIKIKNEKDTNSTIDTK